MDYKSYVSSCTNTQPTDPIVLLLPARLMVQCMMLETRQGLDHPIDIFDYEVVLWDYAVYSGQVVLLVEFDEKRWYRFEHASQRMQLTSSGGGSPSTNIIGQSKKFWCTASYLAQLAGVLPPANNSVSDTDLPTWTVQFWVQVFDLSSAYSLMSSRITWTDVSG